MRIDGRAFIRPLQLAGLLAGRRWSQDSLRRIQERGLRAIVRHAVRRVPFYRELYRKAGVEPGSILGLEQLARLPIVEKKDLQERPLPELLAEGLDPAACTRSSSSGSSGPPLTVFRLAADRNWMNLGWKRAYLSCGLRPGDRLASFIGGRHARAAGKWRERSGIFPWREISTWLEPRQWVDELRAWRPQAISGYVMTLRLLADFMVEQGITDIRPRVLFHSSALLDAESRRLFSRVFSCPVIDLYGSEEAGCIAWECRTCGGYHVAADQVIVEVLKDGRPARPGEQGEVVVTNLHSRAMPFIRYRQGDVVTVSQEPPRCGIRFPLLAGIEGRVDDFIVLKGGRRLSPHPVYHCIDPVPGVRHWRILQEKPGRIRLELVVGGDSLPAARERIAGRLLMLAGGELEVEIERVQRIPDVPGVKFRRIRSRAARRAPASPE